MICRWIRAPLWTLLLLTTVPQVADAQVPIPTPKTITAKKDVRAVTIPAPTLTRVDPTGCTFRWAATVRNDTGVTQEGLGLQAYTIRNGWVEDGASGVGLPALAAGGSSSESITFSPWDPSTYVYLAVKRGDEKLWIGPRAMLPARPKPEEALAIMGSVNATSFSVSVKNKLADGYPGEDFQLQAWTAPSASGPWPASPYVSQVSPLKDRPTGWLSLSPNSKCLLAGGQSETLTASKPIDHRYVKVDLIRSSPPGGPKAGDPPWPKPVVVSTRVLEPPIKPVVSR